ncbi:hypothetical protein [Nocardioides sp. B-3]|uniref:hypothetical protein n=1 Tax=Nocardioides sp. B-3 TaxID=2895565 RepID=UPI00300E37CE
MGRRAATRSNNGITPAQADGERQDRVVSHQFAGRVGLFLRVEDFDAAHERMRRAGVAFITEPRWEPCTAKSSSSSTSPATAGTCSDRCRLDERSASDTYAAASRNKRLCVLSVVRYA